jgi:hypothetical protein
MKQNQFPFDLTVYITRRPHMRCESLEYELHMGRTVLENIFDREVVDETKTEVYLSYPERWCNIVEERSIYPRLQRYYPNLKKVTIKTQSVYIIQCTPAGCCLITAGEEEQNSKLTQESDKGRLWFPNVGNVINASKLNVL